MSDSIGKSWKGALQSICPEILGQAAGGEWFREYEGRELAFSMEILGHKHPQSGMSTNWAFQRYLLEALFEHKMVVVRSARGSGKNHVIGGDIIPTFMATAPSRCITLAPTWEHNRDNMWSQIHTAVGESLFTLPGKLGVQNWRISAECYAKGVTAKDKNNVRGYHAGTRLFSDPDSDEPDVELDAEVEDAANAGVRLLIVVDECQGIPNDVLQVLFGMMNKPNVYVIFNGNPDLGLDDDHEYVHACKAGSRFHSIKVSAFPDGDYPDPLAADKVFDHIPTKLVSEESLEDAKRKYEPNSSIFLSDFLGQFATGSTQNLVITRTLLTAALAIQPTAQVGLRMGVDLGFKSDPCVASLFLNRVKIARESWLPEADDMEAQETIAVKIMELMQTWGVMAHKKYPKLTPYQAMEGPQVSIDITGLPGVADILARKGIYVDRVNYSKSPMGCYKEIIGKTRFKNTRAEMYWTARCLLQEGMAQIPEAFSQSWDQLTWTHFEREVDKKGPVIKMEKKDEIKKRHGRSPDESDADVMALRPTRAPLVGIGGGSRKKKRDKMPRIRKNPRRGLRGRIG